MASEISHKLKIVSPLREDSGGAIRVGKTRVTLDTVVYAFKGGNSAEEIIDQYPSLKLADVVEVIAYYLRNRDDVEGYLRLREEEAAELRRKIEAEYNPVGLREKLLARRKTDNPE